MPKSPPLLAFVALAMMAAPGGLAAQPHQQPQTHPSDFGSLWTGWGSANADSLKIEREGVERVREDYARAAAERRHALENQGRALGERVGEIVRTGDCAEGERVARAAGDFALVTAVRTHCEPLRNPGR